MEKILNLIYQLLNPSKERYVLKYAKRPNCCRTSSSL